MVHELRLEKLAKSVKAFGLPALFEYLQWSCETCKYRIGDNPPYGCRLDYELIPGDEDYHLTAEGDDMSHCVAGRKFCCVNYENGNETTTEEVCP